MNILSKKEFRALALLLVTVLLLEFFFGGVSVRLKTAYSNIAARQVAAIGDPQARCTSSVAGVSSLVDVGLIHRICNPPGPQPKGRDGLTCTYVGAGLGPDDLPKGHTITGTCNIGCCTAMKYTPAGTAISNFGGNFLGTLGNSIVTSVVAGTVSQLVGSLFGGGGGGSYNGGSGVQFRNAAEEQAYLQFSNDQAGDELNFNDLDLAFGSNTADDNTTSLAYGTGGNQQTERSAQAVEQQGDGQEGDSVTTRYESLQSRNGQDVAPLPGETEFEQDYFGATLHSSGSRPAGENGSLTLADLELQAQELQRQQNFDTGQQNNTGGLQDLRSSNIARSNDSVGENPLSNSRYDDLDYERLEDELTWWQKLIELIGRLIGVN